MEIRISPKPVFDVEKAMFALETVNALSLRSPCLRVAAALILYNSDGQKYSLERALRRITYLKESEEKELKSCLPTIGIEVETPRKVFNKERAGLYAWFNDFIGFQRNKACFNVKYGDPQTYTSTFWEFFTYPASSYRIVNSTLHSLIEGGFIPHLENSNKASDRVLLLDEKLVSMHINIGVPPSIDNPFNQPDDEFLRSDIELLSSSFPLTFTSPERLKQRSSGVFVNTKSAVPTEKYPETKHRIELKAFEVGTKETYRLLKEIQLVSGAMFSLRIDGGELIGDIWLATRERVRRIYNKYDFTPVIMQTNKPLVFDLTKKGDITRELREALTEAALEVSKVIKKA